MFKKLQKMMNLFKSIVLSCFISIVSIGYTQSPILRGTVEYNNDLYHKKNFGIGSSEKPSARLHIFADAVFPYENHIRPFLIEGFFNLSDSLQTQQKLSLLTVTNQGYLGIGLYEPLNKLHLHNGIFTITESATSRWDMYANNSFYAVKDFDADKFRFYIDKASGYIGIGTEDPIEKLVVDSGNLLVNYGDIIVKGNNKSTDGNTEIILQSNGYIRAREIKVDLDVIPDYVFASDYKLMPLEEVKQFITNNKHLPNVKSEADYQAEGSIALTELNLKLLEKVEELTLYIIDLQEQINALKSK